VEVAADVITDLSGNLNTASNILTFIFDTVAPTVVVSTAHALTTRQVRFCRHRVSATGDLGYSGIRGAVGLGAQVHCIADPKLLLLRFYYKGIKENADWVLLNPEPSCFGIKTGRGKT
jgi:hypothetical protein